MQSSRSYSDVKRYTDESLNVEVVQLLPGQCYVSTTNEHITTVLGSCVAVCLRDESTGFGGMNHFMLPGGSGEQRTNEIARFGAHAMEILISDLFKVGADRNHLVAKIFGGGSMFESEQDIGIRNAEFAQEFLNLEGIDLAVKDIGTSFARKIRFVPKTGKVMVKKLESLHTKQVQEIEHKFASGLFSEAANDEVKLFDWYKKVS